MERRSFTVRDPALRWNVRERTVYRAISRGDLKHFRVGVSVRIPAEAVERFEAVKSQVSQLGSDAGRGGRAK